MKKGIWKQNWFLTKPTHIISLYIHCTVRYESDGQFSKHMLEKAMTELSKIMTVR